ncbi:MAG: hypothetical protein A2166_03070 [Omnitrophica WOR_2 bacterium RBG_13_41_10]|nr:MAG: hypothetical protein A2166_03070 [Omnitrophica WOR_2 bacterium RBG_13_41_10]
MKILYPIIDGEITGGNIICFKIIEEALKRGYQTIVNSPAEGKFTHLLKEKGIKVYNIDTRRTFRLDSAIKLARIIKKEGISLIHTHTPLSGAIISRMAAKLSNIPLVNHEHGLSSLNSNSLIRRCQLFLNTLTVKSVVCRIIAVSQATRTGLIQRGIPKEIVRLIYNGVLVENGQTTNLRSRNEILKELGLSSSLLLIGQVGRIDEKKGQHIFIRAAQRVLEDFPNTAFLIVGEDFRNGVYQEQLKTLAKNLNVIDHVVFTGYHPDIMDIMNVFDLFVLPSLIEGLPVVILEAMAAKKPVITTSVGGNPEVVIDGETGTLISPEDPDKLAEAILYHLNNPEISKRMGEKGYERVRQFFSLPQMLNKVMDIYKEVLAER